MAISIDIQDVEADTNLMRFCFIYSKWLQFLHELKWRYFYLVEAFCKVKVKHLSKVGTVNANHILYVLDEALFQQNSDAIYVTSWHDLIRIRFAMKFLEGDHYVCENFVLLITLL